MYYAKYVLVSDRSMDRKKFLSGDGSACLRSFIRICSLIKCMQEKREAKIEIEDKYSRGEREREKGKKSALGPLLMGVCHSFVYFSPYRQLRLS